MNTPLGETFIIQPYLAISKDILSLSHLLCVEHNGSSENPLIFSSIVVTDDTAGNLGSLSPYCFYLNPPATWCDSILDLNRLKS